MVKVMEYETVAKRIEAYLAALDADHQVPLDRETDLFASGILDSLRVVDFIAFAEDEFGITIPNWTLTLDNFRTISVVANFVLSLRG